MLVWPGLGGAQCFHLDVAATAAKHNEQCVPHDGVESGQRSQRAPAPAAGEGRCPTAGGWGGGEGAAAAAAAPRQGSRRLRRSPLWLSLVLQPVSGEGAKAVGNAGEAGDVEVLFVAVEQVPQDGLGTVRVILQ